MKINSLMLAIGSLVGLSGLAVTVANRAEASVDAACIQCFMVLYPSGGTVTGCRTDSNNRTYGNRYCMITPTSCDTFGYGSCS